MNNMIYTPNIIGQDNKMINPLKVSGNARSAGPIINYEFKSLDSKKQMRNRVVAPVYDDDFECMVGCVGRIMHEDYNGRKWVNSKKFYAGAWLYGYWLSREHIKNSRMAVLVEGQGDVWRLWEAGIKNVVGMFGSGLTDTQIRILETSGATTLVLLPDNDEAGAKAIRSARTYSI